MLSTITYYMQSFTNICLKKFRQLSKLRRADEILIVASNILLFSVGFNLIKKYF